MDFPDFKHFLQLQKYLWQWPSSRASVMIGAGLSLNSRPVPGANASFPTWEAMARSMFNEIYPLHPGATPEQKKEREGKSKSANVVRIASKYEAAFQRPKLRSFLLEQIPDSDHNPGEIHSLLLQLPWKDIFTTNYDTLLERTEVPGRAYQPVTTVNDLTHASSPRIIKLHGSFPSLTEFTITEEDYRTYPRRFAPFVNTVRQALIENAFVAVGFSGNDPNFLEWTGWIRDELGDDHAPIYLVGPLSLDDIERSLLEKRGVTSIDLAPVVANESPGEDIHAVALKWFTRNLLDCKPQRPDKWPKISAASSLVAGLEIADSGEVVEEPKEIDASVDTGKELNEETVRKIFARWRYERNRYPGWLVPTREVRASLWAKTRRHMFQIVNSTTNWPLVDRILLFSEINWRIDTAMLPHFLELIPPFEFVIDDLFCSVRDKDALKKLNRGPIAQHAEEKVITEAWLEVAYGLLRDARESYDAESWNMLWSKIELVLPHCPHFIDRHHYEHALWMAWNLQRDQAKEVLANWSPSSQSPLAVIWKAGLITEWGELSEAQSLLRGALREIRKSLHSSHGRNIGLLSLEGWCTYLLFFVEVALDRTRWGEIRGEFSARWKELRAWDCDPWLLKQSVDEVVSETPPKSKTGKQIIPGFDPGHTSVRYRLGGDSIDPLLPAFACIRLYEQAGIPMRMSDWEIGGKALANACKWIAPFSKFWSPAILVRSGNVKALTERGFMSRVRVAAMPATLTQNLNKWAMRALTEEFSALGKRIDFESSQASLLEVLIELLSRLTFRLEAVDLQEAFSFALDVHRNPSISSHIRLCRSCAPWFKRLFEAANDQQLLEWLPDLLNFPLQDRSNRLPTVQRDRWVDPAAEIPAERVRRAAQETALVLPPDLADAIEWLLQRTQGASEEGRLRGIRRLISLYHTEVMTQEQQSRFASILWEKTNEDSLPQLPDFPYFNYLYLPKPDAVDVESNVRHCLKTRKWTKVADGRSMTISASGDENQMIQEIAFASKPVVQIPHEPLGMIEWEDDDAKDLWRKALEWWENVKHILIEDRSSPFPMGRDHILPTLDLLGMFLARTVLPKMDAASEDEWEIVFTFLLEARERGVYLTRALPYVLLHRSSYRDQIEKTILDDLSSGKKKAVASSARAIRHWTHLSDAKLVKCPPAKVVNALIWRVVFRRPEGVQSCMEQLAILLVEKPDFFDLEQINTIVASLGPWDDAISLSSELQRDSDFLEDDRPALRVLLGRLALGVSIWFKKKFPNKEEPAKISELRESFKKDHLPEVRRAFDPWKW